MSKNSYKTEDFKKLSNKISKDKFVDSMKRLDSKISSISSGGKRRGSLKLDSININEKHKKSDIKYNSTSYILKKTKTLDLNEKNSQLTLENISKIEKMPKNDNIETFYN